MIQDRVIHLKVKEQTLEAVKVEMTAPQTPQKTLEAVLLMKGQTVHLQIQKAVRGHLIHQEQTQVVASSQPPQVTVVNNIPSSEGQRSSSGQEQPQQQNQVQQSTDNIRIEANGVNVVYEVIDGVHSISINANVQEASKPVFQQLSAESPSVPSAEKQMVNWYEIAKVILLAGILVNLMWERKEKD